MTALKLGAIAVALVTGIAAAAWAAPNPGRSKDSDTSKAAPKPGRMPIRKPPPPQTEIIECPISIPVTHSPQIPAGFRDYTTIRNYNLRICQSRGTEAVASTRTAECNYCDDRQTGKLKISKPWPAGMTCQAEPRGRRIRCTGK